MGLERASRCRVLGGAHRSGNSEQQESIQMKPQMNVFSLSTIINERLASLFVQERGAGLQGRSVFRCFPLLGFS